MLLLTPALVELDLAGAVGSARFPGSERGIRAVKLSLLGLGITAAIQAGGVAVSGSVALLGDTLHNLADALTAVPLWVAFTLGRRPPNRRYPYGYGRAEDVAGVLIVLAIAASAVAIGFVSVTRLVNPQSPERLGAVAAAAAIGLLGNEAVAAYRIRVGRAIGSAALIADGRHACTDALTSAAVLAGSGGVALGWELADPVVRLAITVVILLVLRSAAIDIYQRLMDAVDPGLVDEVARVLASIPGVEGVDEVRIRWIGHHLHAEVRITVGDSRSVTEAHDVAEDAYHTLLHELPRLASAIVHTDPASGSGPDPHAQTLHHERPGARR